MYRKIYTYSVLFLLATFCASQSFAQSIDSIVGSNGHCLPTTLSVVTSSGVPEVVIWKKGATTPLKDTILWNHHGVRVAGDDSAGGTRLNQLNYPRGTFVTGNGDIYVADMGIGGVSIGNHRIVKWSPPYTTGVIVAGSAVGTAPAWYTALNAPSQDSLLFQPLDIWVDASGNLYVLDQGGVGYNFDQRILRFPAGSTAGTMGTVIAGYGSGGVTPALKSPTAFWFHTDPVSSTLYLYVVDNANHCVTRYPYNGTIAGNGTVIVNTSLTSGNDAVHLNTPQDLFIKDSANVTLLYVTDVNNSRVMKYTLSGSVPAAGYSGTVAAGITAAAAPPTTNPTILCRPNGIWVDCSGYVYVGDAGNSRVIRFPPGSVSGSAGTTIAGFGAATSPGNDSSFHASGALFMNDINVNGIVNDGTLYAVDWSSAARVMKFNINSPQTLPLTNIAGNVSNLWNATVTYFGCTGTPTSVSPNFKTYLTPAAGSITVSASTNISACGATDGSITISGLNGGSTYYVQYTFNGSASPSTFPSFLATGSSYTFTGLPAGNYTNILIGIDPTYACSIPVLPNVTLTLPIAPTPPVLAGGNAYTACSGSTVSLSVTSPIGAGITYQYSPAGNFATPNPTSATTQTTTTLAAGVQNDTVFAVKSGCISSGTPFTVTVTQSPVITSHSHIQPTGCTTNDGKILLNGLPAGTVYIVKYTLAGVNHTITDTVNGFGTLTINGLSAGQYDSIRVSASGCSSSPWISETLTAPNPPTFTLAASSPTTCGGTDGCITINGLQTNNNNYVLSASPSITNLTNLS
ncbi:MAG: NHL repeat-containing protein, partial [Bacteroidota bacterium]